MFPNFAVPPLWIPDGTHQRLIGLSAVKSITFAANQQGMYFQTLSQNVRVTIDGTNPVASGNDTGFQVTASEGRVLIVGYPGMVVKIIQETASAVVQYQMLTLSGRFN